MLFRYSALTHNGHRIHYDADYAREAEGYPGLVVHAPLMATVLADHVLATTSGAAMAEFAFRALKPVYAGQPVRPVAGTPDGAGGLPVRMVGTDQADHVVATARLS